MGETSPHAARAMKTRNNHHIIRNIDKYGDIMTAKDEEKTYMPPYSIDYGRWFFDMTIKQIDNFLNEKKADAEEKDIVEYCRNMILRLNNNIATNFSISAELRLDIANLVAYYSTAHSIMGTSDSSEMLMASKRSEISRLIKQKKAAARRGELRRAILEETSGVGLMDTDKYASSIVDGVHRRLGLDSGWPSVRTVRREIEAILKECEKIRAKLEE